MPMANASTELLAAHLWDLRAAGEAKLRCLTRVQQMLTEYGNLTDSSVRMERRTKIIEDLTDVVSITGRLQSTSAEALAAAQLLE